MRRFRSTGFHAAINSNVAVQPVVIYCKPLFLGKNQQWYTFSKAKNKMVIEFLKPVRLNDLPQQEQTVKGLSDHISNVIKDRLDELEAEFSKRSDI
jgi:1-acyl-sn-glycerol-3-phosphate acyltransferase